MKKILNGIKNIHVAKLNENETYETPIFITNAKSVDVELNYEQVNSGIENGINFADYVFDGGKGALTISNLTVDEYNLLFDSNGNSSEFALLFELDEQIFYTVFAIKFASLTVKNNTDKLEFSVRELSDGAIFHMADLKCSENVKISNWYKEVLKPY